MLFWGSGLPFGRCFYYFIRWCGAQYSSSVQCTDCKTHGLISVVWDWSPCVRVCVVSLLPYYVSFGEMLTIMWCWVRGEKWVSIIRSCIMAICWLKGHGKLPKCLRKGVISSKAKRSQIAVKLRKKLNKMPTNMSSYMIVTSHRYQIHILSQCLQLFPRPLRGSLLTASPF